MVERGGVGRDVVERGRVGRDGVGLGGVGRNGVGGGSVTGFDSPLRQGIFLPESTFSADSLTVSVQPPCAIVCIEICTLEAIPLFGQTKTMHTLVGMAGAVLVAAVVLPR